MNQPRRKSITTDDLPTLNMGDVLEWTFDENGCAVAGGQAIVLDDTSRAVEKTAYDIGTINVHEIVSRADRCWVVANIFKDRDFKLQVDKRIVMKDRKPVIVHGVVQME